MTTEKRYPTINGNDYYIKIVEKKRKKRVSVYNDDEHGGHHRGMFVGNYIFEDVQRRGWLFGIGPDNSDPIEKMVQNTLNKAVCIRENKENKEEEFEDKIGQAVSSVCETHEDKI